MRVWLSLTTQKERKRMKDRHRHIIIDWLIDYLLFYVPLKNILLMWRRHHYRWRAAKFRLMLGAQGLKAGRDLYRATPAVTKDLGFSGLIWRTASFSRLLRHTRGCGGYILTWILTGLWCYLLWRERGPLYEEIWIPFTQKGCVIIWLKLACWFWRRFCFLSFSNFSSLLLLSSLGEGGPLHLNKL
jgi:hypothetical protein